MKNRSTKKVRVGIVGCGGISRAHLRGYEADGGCVIVAVYDPVAAAADALAEATGAVVAESAAAMAIRDDTDAVSICTPPATHTEACRPFLGAGIAVLCEKPLGVDADDARALSAAVESSASLFMTAFCHRFHPAVLEMRQLIDSGALGRLLFFRNIFAGYTDLTGNHRTDPSVSGGGPIIDHCSHSIDLYRYLVGQPESVSATIGNVQQRLPIEDLGMMHLAGPGDVFGEITGSYSLPGAELWVEVFGTKGMARIGYGDVGQPDFSYRIDGARDWTVVETTGRPDRFTTEIAHFLECVRDGGVPSITVDDGLAASEIVAAAYESARSGCRVRIP